MPKRRILRIVPDFKQLSAVVAFNHSRSGVAKAWNSFGFGLLYRHDVYITILPLGTMHEQV